jgi:hypothetical protein
MPKVTIEDPQLAHARNWLKENGYGEDPDLADNLALLLCEYENAQNGPITCPEHKDTPLGCPRCFAASGGKSAMATLGPEHYRKMNQASVSVRRRLALVRKAARPSREDNRIANQHAAAGPAGLDCACRSCDRVRAWNGRR